MKNYFFVLFYLLLLFTVAAEESAEVEGDTITITASVPETTQQKEVLEKEEIDRLRATDIISVLEKGFHLGVISNGSYGNTASVNIRGFGSGRVAILVDGVPVNSPQSGAFDLSSIDVNNVERIEVIKGGSDSKYNVSGAIGGIINIITVKKQEEGFRVGADISNTGYIPGYYFPRGEVAEAYSDITSIVDTQKIGLNIGYGAEDYSLALNWFGNKANNNFIFKDDFDVKRLREGNEVRDTGASASFVYDLKNSSSIILSADIYSSNKNIPSDISSAIIGKQKDFFLRQSIILDFKDAGSENIDTEAFLNHTMQNMSYENPTTDSLHQLHTISASNRWNWYVLDVLQFTFSGDYQFSYLDSTNTGIKYNHDGGVSVSVKYSPVPIISIVPSVKIVVNNNTVVPVPKLGFVYYLTDEFTLKNNWFRVFKFPNFNDLYWGGDALSEGNPDLKPEDGFGADLIAEYDRVGWFSASTAFHVTWAKDSIHWRSIGGVWKPVNIGEALMFGLDTKISTDFTKYFTFSLNYSFLMSYVLTGDLTFSSNIRMPYMPMHRFGFTGYVPWKTGSVVITGNFESFRYIETLNIIKLNHYFLLDVTVNQNIVKNFLIFASLRNIFNQSYYLVDNYPMPEFNFTIGLNYEYRKKPKDEKQDKI